MKPGLKQIAIGVYADDRGGLHLFVNELLEANGYADTPENRATLTQAARETMATLYPNQPLTDDAQRLENDPAITRIVDFTCPHCRQKSNAAGTTDGAAGSPTPGDLCGCIYCGCPMKFLLDPIDGHTLRLRKITEAELDDLSTSQLRELMRVRSFAEHMQRERHSRN